MGLQRHSAVTCRFGQGAHKLGENKTAIIVSCGFISNGRLLVCAVLFWQQKKSCSSSAQELHLALRAYMCDYVRGRRWSSSLGRYYAGIWGGYLNDLHRWQHCCCQHGGNVIKRKAFFFFTNSDCIRVQSRDTLVEGMFFGLFSHARMIRDAAMMESHLDWGRLENLSASSKRFR